MDNDTSRARSRTGSPEANGHNGYALEVNPFDTPESREKRRKRKEAEQAAAAASTATIVSGRYAAEVCKGLSAEARKALMRLTAVSVADLTAVGALTGPRPTKGDVTAWHGQRRE